MNRKTSIAKERIDKIAGLRYPANFILPKAIDSSSSEKAKEIDFRLTNYRFFEMPTTTRSDLIIRNENFNNQDQSHISKQPQNVRLLKDSRRFKYNVTKSLFTPEKENLNENLEYRVKKVNILNPMPISGNEPSIKQKSNNYNVYKLILTNDSDRDSTTNNAHSEQFLDTNKLFNFYNNQLSQQIPIRRVIKSPPSRFEKGTNSLASIAVDLVCQSLAINKLQLSKSNS